MKSADFKIGDRVVYVPMHAHGDRQHEDCEHGRVTSVGFHGTVFVQFRPSSSAQACDPALLELE